MTKDIIRLARSVKPLRVALSDGGELKDPTKRAAFMNLFTPRATETNLPAVVAAPPSSPVVQPTPSSGPVSAENPDIIAHATKALMEAPLTRRKFLETTRNAVAAANQAGNINKLLTPIEPPHQIPEHIPETPKFDKIGFVENTLKEIFDQFEESAYDFAIPYDHLKGALEGYMKRHPKMASMKNVKNAINELHSPEEFIKNYFDHMHFTKEELDHLGENDHLNQLLAFHDENILPNYGKYEWNDMKDAAKEAEEKRKKLIEENWPKKESAGGRIGKNDGGSLSERRAAAQAKIKELSGQLRNHAPGSSEHEALKQEIKDQGKIIAEKSEAPPPQKVVGIGHNNPPELAPLRLTNKLGTYSHAAEVAENSNVDRMSPSEWVKFLANKPGVKKEELRWADIAGMTPTPGEKTVSKKQVSRRLEDASLEDYTETVRSNKYLYNENGIKRDRNEINHALALDSLKDPDLLKKIYGQNPDFYVDLHHMEEEFENRGYKGELLRNELARYLADAYSYSLNKYISATAPKFESYTLKGKNNNENYREIIPQYKPDHPLFKYENHYPEDNPLFHLRLADLHTPEGKKLLHVEEVQGDWGQQGRGKFSNEKIDKNALRDEYNRLDNEHDEASKKFRIAKNAFFDKLSEPITKHQAEHNQRRYNYEGNMTDEWRNTFWEERRRIENEHYAEQNRLQDEVNEKFRQHSNEYFAGTEVEPFYKKKKEAEILMSEAWRKYNNARDTISEGPHVTETKAWTKLAVKRILKEAAEGGYHGIVLTPGSEQSKRWSGQPGVQQFYDETLEPMLDKELKSHDPDAGKSNQPFLMKATKRIDDLDHQAIAEIMGMPIPTNDTERTDVQNAWFRTTNAQQLRNDWESSGKNFRTTEKPLPTFNMTPKAAASIPNNQKLFKRGGFIGKSEGGEIETPKMSHNNPPMDEHPDQFRELNKLGLYSKAAEVAQDATGQNIRQTPEQWKNYLLGRGVKPDELKWSHFENAFHPDEKVHKNDLAAHFNYNNQKPYTEQVYKNEGHDYENNENGIGQLALDMSQDYDLFKKVIPQKFLQKQAKIKEAEGEDVADWLTDNWSDSLQNYIENQKNSEGQSPTRHSGYQMEGPSENYREIVLQHNPEDEKFRENFHFPDASNPLLHIRMSDRKGPNGEKLLLIEELQSDWGQNGADAGFNEQQKKAKEEKFQALNREMHALDFTMRNRARKAKIKHGANPDLFDNSNDSLHRIMHEYALPEEFYHYLKLKTKHEKALKDFRAPMIEEGPHVGDTNTWTDLGLKRILKEAADGGYHGITFAPGKTQAARWSTPGLEKPYDVTIPSRMQKLINRHDDSLKFQPYSMPISFNEPHKAHYLPMSEKAATSIKKGQERFRRGGNVKAPVAKSRNIIHNPAIIELALNKLRSMPRDTDSPLSGQQGRLFN